MADPLELHAETLPDSNFNIAGTDSTVCHNCPICTSFQHLDDTWEALFRRGKSICSVGQLKNHNACGLAAKLIGMLQVATADESLIILKLDPGVRWYRQFKGGITAQLFLTFPDGKTTQFGLMNAFALPDSSASRFIQSSPANPFPASSNTFDAARSWISQCRQNHSRCPKISDTALPTRVLDVGKSSDSVRLTETKKMTGSYAALSYCWGASQSMTTISNYPAGCQQIKLNDVAKTIRDAIIVARQLGIRYLWVDALCIIQDDPEDKYAELGNMSNIYKNALITISIARSRSCHEGFLYQNEHLISWLRQAFKLHFRCPDGTMDYIYLADWKGGKTEKEPIDYRTWTFQEAWLSPRTILFSSSHTLWQCMSTVSADGNCAPWERLSAISTFSRSINFSLDADATEEDWLQARRMAHLQWADVVHEVTLRLLSVPDDKLPAISAMANELASWTGDSYLAGIWRSNLLPSLLWCQQSRWCLSKNAASVSRPEKYRAPSWSWASVEGPVDLHNSTSLHHESRVRVLAAETIPESEKAPFGAVKSGFLELHAPMRRMRCDELIDLFKGTGDDGVRKLYPDCGEIFPPCSTPTVQSETRLTDKHGLDCDKYWLVEIFTSELSVDHEIKGLLLESLGSGICRRLGYFYIEEFTAEHQPSLTWDSYMEWQTVRIF